MPKLAISKSLFVQLNYKFKLLYIRFISFFISAVDNGTIQLSPIFFGILLTLLVLTSYCMIRVLWKRSQQQKNDDVTNGSKQSSSLLCTGVGGNGNGIVNNANHTDTITKVCTTLSMLSPYVPCHWVIISLFFIFCCWCCYSVH